MNCVLISRVFHNVKPATVDSCFPLLCFGTFGRQTFALFKTKQLLLQLDLRLSKGAPLKKRVVGEALCLLPWYPHVPVLPYIFLKAYNSASQTAEQDAGRQLHPPGTPTACSVQTHKQGFTQTHRHTHSQFERKQNRAVKTFLLFASLFFGGFYPKNIQ